MTLQNFNPYQLVRPLLFLIDPEKAHHLTITLLQKGLMPHVKNDTDPALHVKLCGLDFPNPVGLAAGFDKHAEVIGAMLGFGFGSVEIGSITPRPQIGNPKPRLFRIPEAEAVINRFGFNSDGFEIVGQRIAAYRDSMTQQKIKGIVGINIGKNKESPDAAADYTAGITKFAPFADYLTVNISSPNTPGLRDLQGRVAMADLLKQVVTTRNTGVKKPPVFVKVAPDLTHDQMEDVAEVALSTGIDGLIVGNTTLSRPASIPPKLAAEAGGLSGKPLTTLSTQVLAQIYKLTGGKIPLIGCGGISSGEDAYAKIRAGASLVQLYSALVYHGPFLIPRINRDLVKLLQRDGFRNVQEAVGSGIA